MILRVLLDDQGEEALRLSKEHFPHWYDRTSMMADPCPVRDWCVERFGRRAGEIDRLDDPPHAVAVIDTNRQWVETGIGYGFKTADQWFEFKMRWHGVPVT